MMNTEDADVVDFLDLATHLGYLGYRVKPPVGGDPWFLAEHSERWNFAFRRWRSILFLQCSVSLPEADAADIDRVMEWLNDLRLKARLTSYSAATHPPGEAYLEATAILPVAYDRAAFGGWIMTWIEELSRLTLPVPRLSGMSSSSCE